MSKLQDEIKYLSELLKYHHEIPYRLQNADMIQAIKLRLENLQSAVKRGGARGKRKPVLNTPEAAANRARVQKFRAKQKKN